MFELVNAFTGESEEGATVLECPECGSEMRLVETKMGRFYGCSEYPICKTTHGCHPDGSPLGVPANKETRLARIEAHRWFDVLWKSGRLKRRAAYRKLQGFMGMDKDECHIGRFSKGQCEMVVIFARGACKIYGISPQEGESEEG